VISMVREVERKLYDLQALCWDAIYYPDARTFVEPLVALVGSEAMFRLEREVRVARILAGGLKSYALGDDNDTVTVLMLRLLADPDWTERLVVAYRTIIREGLDTVGVDVRETDDEWLPLIEVPPDAKP
jgi:hypothetical protein